MKTFLTIIGRLLAIAILIVIGLPIALGGAIAFAALLGSIALVVGACGTFLVVVLAMTLCMDLGAPATAAKIALKVSDAVDAMRDKQKAER